MVVLFVMLITTLVVVTVLDTETVRMAATRNTSQYEQARYLAEAGVSHALAMLEADPGWRTGISSTEFPSGSGNTYSAVAVDGADETVVVTATGIAGDTTRKLVCTTNVGD